MPFDGATKIENEDVEVPSFSGATKVQEGGEDFDFGGLVSGAANIANDINYGITSSIPGLNYFSSKIGIGEEINRGEDGKPTVGQGAFRMTGMASTYALGMLSRGTTLLGEGLTTGPVKDAAVQVSQKSKFVDAVDSFLANTAKTFASNRAGYTASEVAAASAAGAAGQAVYNETESPTARLAAELGAGVATAGVVPLAKTVSQLAPSAMAARFIASSAKKGWQMTKQAFGKEIPEPERITRANTSTPGAQRASERLKGVVGDDLEEIIHKKAEPTLKEAPLTNVEKTENPELLSLEKSIVNSSEQLSFDNQARVDTINIVIRDAIENVETRSVRPDEARSYLDNLIEERIRIAGIKAQESIDNISPKASRETANNVVREQIDIAYEDVLKQEVELWGAVPSDTMSVPSKAINVLRDRLVTDDRVKKQLANVPQVLKSFLGRLNKKGEFKPGRFHNGAQVKELQSLRSEILREVRAERAKDAPDRVKISLLNDVQTALLDDMSVPGGAELDAAIGFSKDLNVRFRQGDVGRILGYERTGEGAVPPMLTLEKTLGRYGAAGTNAKQSAKEIMDATNTPETRAAMEDFLSDEFLGNSRLGGDFDPTSGARWLRDRRELMEYFPALKSRIEAAINSGNANAIAAGMKNPKNAPAAIILGKQPDDAMRDIMGSADPKKTMSAVVSELNNDPTGRALVSMRRSAIDWIIEKSQSKQVYDSNENAVIIGTRLKDILEDPYAKEAFGELLSPEQFQRLNVIKNTALKIERSQKASPARGGVINDVEGAVSELLRKVMAAGAGRHFGQAVGSGGTVQIPGQFVSFSNKLRDAGIDPARKLIMDAVLAEDDKLLKSILLLPEEKLTKQAMERVNAWIYATGRELGITDMAEEKENI